MATKSKRATLKDLKNGKTVWTVWLGEQTLVPEVHRLAGRPFTNKIATWVPVFSPWGHGRSWRRRDVTGTKESLSSLGVIHDCGRYGFTTAKAAARFCKEQQGRPPHLTYLEHLQEFRTSLDWGGFDDYDDYDDYEEPSQEYLIELLERTVPEFNMERFHTEGGSLYPWQIPQVESCLWEFLLIKHAQGTAAVARIGPKKYRLDGVYDQETKTWVPQNVHLWLERDVWYQQDCWAESALKVKYEQLTELKCLHVLKYEEVT